MQKKLCILIPLVLISLVCMTSNAGAASFFWKVTAPTTAWENPNNWDSGQVPGPGDDGIIVTTSGNLPHFTTASTTVDGTGMGMVGYQDNGGTFYMDSGLMINNFAFGACKSGTKASMPQSTCVMSGGTIAVLGRFWPDSGAQNGGTFIWPRQTGRGVFTMNGGLIDLYWAFFLPGYNTDTKGEFRLNSGTVNMRFPYDATNQTNGFWIGENASRLLGKGSNKVGTMSINGGQLILEGDYTALMSKYVDSCSVIIAYPDDSNSTNHKYIVYDYDDRVDGKTKVTGAKADIAKAWKPSPIDAARFASRTLTLSWRIGQDANTHNVYFATDNPPATLLATRHSHGTQHNTYTDPCSVSAGTLVLGRTYYWKVNEVNETTATTTEGDVWSLTVQGRAKSPTPENGGTDIVTDPNTNLTLKWTAGAYSTSHAVYVSTDSASMGSATQVDAPGNTLGATPAMNTTYFWRVDETGSYEAVTGTTWSFTTANYRRVEDFERYAAGDTAIATKWKNARDTSGGCFTLPVIHLNVPAGGAANLAPSHLGLKAMGFYYVVNNCNQRVSRDYTGDLQNWSSGSSGAKSLSLYIRGKGNNQQLDNIYIKLQDSANVMSNAVYYPDPCGLSVTENYTQWNIDMTSFNNGSFDNTNIKYLHIYVFDNGTKSGQLWVDDIRLYPSRCVPDKSAAGTKPNRKASASESDISDDCIVNWKDVDILSAEWLRGDTNQVPNGIVNGTTTSWVTSGCKTGNCLNLGSSSSTANGWVDIDDLAVGPLSDASHGTTVSFWFKANAMPNGLAYLFATSNEWRVNIAEVNSAGILSVAARFGPDVTTPPYVAPLTNVISTGVWTYVAAVIDTPNSSTPPIVNCYLYVNGADYPDHKSSNDQRVFHYYTHLSGMNIGALNNGLNTFAAITMDDFRIYNRALTDSEIGNIYVGTYPADMPWIKYDFNESSGTIAAQSGKISGNGRYHPTGYVRTNGTYDIAYPSTVDAAEIIPVLAAAESQATTETSVRYVNMKDFAWIAQNWLTAIPNWP